METKFPGSDDSKLTNANMSDGDRNNWMQNGNAFWLAFAVCLLIQTCILLALLSGSIGFDHPGSSGLNFESALVLCGWLLFAIVVNFVLCVVNWKWNASGIQAIFPLVFGVLYVASQLILGN